MIPRPRLVISPADAAKLEEIWKTHASIVLGMLRTFCSCPEDAQDALQELFLRIGKNPAVVESAKSPRAFLIVAARRIAIDLARKRAAEQTRIDSPEAVDALHPAQESIKNDPEVEAAISAAVQKLPPEQRAVFIAKIIQGKTLAVIAAEQHITLNTAASRLRYSLDKIRSQLRPHYEAMKNQTKTPMKNTFSDSSERLIKPLEPKRVPSVAVDCIFLPPSHDGVDDASGEEFEIAYCDPNSGGNAWEHAGTPTAVELPLDSSENEAEPEIVIEDNTAEEEITDEPAVETENRPVDESAQIVDTTEIPEVAICEFPPSNAENFEEPVVIVCEPFIAPPTIEIPTENTEIVDFNGQTTEEILEEIFVEDTPTESDADNEVGEVWTEYAVIDEGVENENPIYDNSGEDVSIVDEGGDFGLGEYHDYLLHEYKGFLAENPDWITENSGGDMHAQVITPSQHTGLELSDPGAAKAFDIWFYNNYIAPYENESPVEEGSLNLAGQPNDYGTLLTTDQPDRTGIPEAWMRGGSVQLSGGGEIVYKTGIVAFDQGSTPLMLGSQNNVANGGSIILNDGAGTLQSNGLSLDKSSAQDLGVSSQTVVTGGTLVANQPVTGTFTVEEGASISANNQTFGPGIYQFTTEEVVSDQENDASTEASSGQAPTEVAKEQSVSKEIPPSNFSSVVPIVSGSEETVDSLSNDRPMFAENTKGSFAAVELPTLVETQTASAPEESHMADDIAFTDDDSFVPAPTAETNTVAPESNAPAKTDVAAAVGGAFTVGTATQAAPTRGASVKKVVPA